jgi:hypothetical protein
MYDNSAVRIDGVIEDLQHLINRGYDPNVALQILHIAELRVLTACVKTNPYNRQCEFKTSGWTEIVE